MGIVTNRLDKARADWIRDHISRQYPKILFCTDAVVVESGLPKTPTHPMLCIDTGGAKTFHVRQDLGE